MNQLTFVWIVLCVGVSMAQRWDTGNPSATFVDPNNPQTRGTQYQAQDGPPYGMVPGNGGDVRPQRPRQQTNGNRDMGSGYVAKDGPPFGNVPNQTDPRQPQVPPRRPRLPGPDGTRSENGVPMFRPTDPQAPIFVNRPPLRNETPQRRTGDGRREEAQRREMGRFYQRQTVDPRTNQRSTEPQAPIFDNRHDTPQRTGDGRREEPQRREMGRFYQRGTVDPRTNQQSTGGYTSRSPQKPSQYHGHQHTHSMVAFSGTVKSSQFYYRNTPVIFDNVLTNIGGGYNSHYGIFTAPSPGVYLINYHAVSRPDGSVPAALDLVKNQYIINSAVGQGLTGSPSNSAVIFLKPHDRIYIQGRAGTSIYCETGHSYCSFNIVRIGSGTF